MGTPFVAKGSMKDVRTPVCAKGNGPSSLKHVHGASHFALWGAIAVGKTIESSSAVRVIEAKDGIALHSGMGASAGRRQIEKVSGSWRNFRCIDPLERLLPSCARLGRVPTRSLLFLLWPWPAGGWSPVLAAEKTQA